MVNGNNDYINNRQCISDLIGTAADTRPLQREYYSDSAEVSMGEPMIEVMMEHYRDHQQWIKDSVALEGSTGEVNSLEWDGFDGLSNSCGGISSTPLKYCENNDSGMVKIDKIVYKCLIGNGGQTTDISTDSGQIVVMEDLNDFDGFKKMEGKPGLLQKINEKVNKLKKRISGIGVDSMSSMDRNSMVQESGELSENESAYTIIGEAYGGHVKDNEGRVTRQSGRPLELPNVQRDTLEYRLKKFFKRKV